MRFHNFLGILGVTGLVFSFLMYGYDLDGIENNGFISIVFSTSVLFLTIWIFASILKDVIQAAIEDSKDDHTIASIDITHAMRSFHDEAKMADDISKDHFKVTPKKTAKKTKVNKDVKKAKPKKTAKKSK